MIAPATTPKGRKCYKCMKDMEKMASCMLHTARGAGSRVMEHAYCLECVAQVFDVMCTNAGASQQPQPDPPARPRPFDVEVISIRRLEGAGQLKAFVDVRIDNRLVITQCAVMDGKRGLFATMPRQLSRDGRWRDVCIETDSNKEITDAVLKAYEQEVQCPTT